MSKRTYPRIGAVTIRSCSKRDGEKTCAQCGEKIKVGSAYALVEVQTDWFRGDGEVAAVCRKCERGGKLNALKLLESTSAT